ALVAVHDQIAGEGVGRQEAPLHARGEARPAPAAETRDLDLLHQLLGRALQRGRKRLVATGAHITIDGVRVVEAHAAEQDVGRPPERHRYAPSLAALIGWGRVSRLSTPWRGTSRSRRPARRSSHNPSKSSGV